MADKLSDFFEVKTGKALYQCSYNGNTVGEEHWEVTICPTPSANSSRNKKGNFILPDNWARTMVFQFINSIDEGLIW